MLARARFRSVLVAATAVVALAACSSDGLDPDTPIDGNVDQDLPPATDTRVEDTVPVGSSAP